ncbi:MAG: Gfo/Idh/MocA family oxidoreductase [Lentisphaeria bacterium]|nr:Gfo/Idh/MocA family oxidoreductase [Lentisphaeria bacterium]
MEELRIGIAGLGFMGSTHLQIYQTIPGVKVTALADVDPVKRKGDISSVINNIGGGDNSKPLDLTGIEVFDNAFDMIKKEIIDVIDICVPTIYHADLVLAGLDAGLHVFCEKPLCRTPEELQKIREKLKHSSTFLNAGMCVRTWPEYAKAKELLDAGVCGKVRIAQFRRLSPDVSGNSWNNWYLKNEISGGAAYDMHLHDTDFICHLFGAPRSVTSTGAKAVNSDGAYDHIITTYDYGDERYITAEGGWCASSNVPFEMSFQIIGDKATLKLDHTGLHIYHRDGRIETPDTGDAALPTGWHRELHYFTGCLLKGAAPYDYQTPESIFSALSVVTAEIKSAESNQKTKVAYF